MDSTPPPPRKLSRGRPPAPSCSTKLEGWPAKQTHPPMTSGDLQFTSASLRASSPGALCVGPRPALLARRPDVQVTMTVNGEQVSREIEPRLLQQHFLRDHLGLTGTTRACDTSNCGACVFSVDGEAFKSCTVPPPMADGRAIRTVEGL